MDYEDWPIVISFTGALLLGIIIGATLMYRAKLPEPTVPDKNKMVERFDKLEERITQMASSRCMTVSTPVLNIQIYEVPNLGKVKVPSPGKVEVENGKPSN
jgi:hypothetical protein